MSKLSFTPQSGPKKHPKRSECGVISIRSAIALVIVSTAIALGIGYKLGKGDSDADQPKRPGVTDVTGDQPEAGSGPPDDEEEPHIKSECSDLTEEEILRMADEINGSRREWGDALSKLISENEKSELSPEEQELVDLLQERRYLEAVEILDTEGIAWEAEQIDSKIVKRAIKEALQPFEKFKKESRRAKNRDQELRALSRLLCRLFEYKDRLEPYFIARDFKRKFPSDVDNPELAETTLNIFLEDKQLVQKVLDILYGRTEDLSEYIENNPVLAAFYRQGELWLPFLEHLATQAFGLSSYEALHESYERYGCTARGIDIWVYGSELEE